MSSLTRNTVPAKPLPIRSSTSARVASSMIGSPGTGIRTMDISGWPTGPTESHRSGPYSGRLTSARISMPSLPT